jgi:glycosyltransferase involved in cell wall biosynthesis
LQQNAYLFVLPDEVGGTHPSLVEAMGFGNCVLVNDTQSNLEAIADAGVSYRGSERDVDLARQLQKLLENPALVARYREKARNFAFTKYRWDDVVREHEKLYRKLLGYPAEVVTVSAARSASSVGD